MTGAVAVGAVGHDAGGAAALQPGGENGAQGAGAGVAAGVDHEHVAGLHLFDGDALRVGEVVHRAVVQILARRDVAQGEGRPGHAAVGPQRRHAVHEGVAQPVFPEHGGQRGGARRVQQCEGVPGHCSPVPAVLLKVAGSAAPS